MRKQYVFRASGRNGLWHFFRTWMSHPRLVGSIVPSSAGLANLITKEIDAKSVPVIELGPGTGVFTRALLNRGVPESQLALVEFEPGFDSALRAQFPEARVLQLDAGRLRQADVLDNRKAGAVVSGLPLLAMSPRKVVEIMDGVRRHLRSDGAFYQFTYAPRCPVPRQILDRLGLKASFMGRVMCNLPPAFVYRIHRRARRSTQAGRLRAKPLTEAVLAGHGEETSDYERIRTNC